MRKALPVLLFAILAFHAIGAGTIPAELTGEWATSQSKFDGIRLTNGIAVYINTNGEAAIYAAPPTAGKKWHAEYDDTNRVMTLSIGPQPADGLPHGLTFRFTYDPNAMALIPNNGLTKSILNHRQDHIPPGVLDGLQ